MLKVSRSTPAVLHIRRLPWDRRGCDHKHGLKLYVQRVFIMDDAEQFMPNYLRFVRGLIDSSDLSAERFREILGQHGNA
ncbi:hypothetical protein ACNKHR_04975 [Shigella flexneri]